MENATLLIEQINDVLWTYILIGLLIACAIWFSIKTKFMQVSMIGEMFRLLGDVNKQHTKGEKHITSFQAFTVSVATRVGTGNLAGVATAISIGGPGAVFWMWIIALMGAATAFIESTLAQLYKIKGEDSFIGGPAYYMEKGLKKRWMGIIFAILITLTFGLTNNTIQSNTICAAFDQAFGVSAIHMGIILTTLTLLIIFGGIQRIAKVSSVIVPIMAIGYVLLAITIVLSNITELPRILKLIFENAFGMEQALGGGIGAAIMQGIKRGLFSNEAGEGSAPNAAATADVSHPVKQGLIQSLGVFTDTLLICSCTAFIILFSGITDSNSVGIQLTQEALNNEVGDVGTYFIAIAILFFAFSSILGNYYYGEANIRFITKKAWVMTSYRWLIAGTVLFGALSTFNLVWALGDVFMAALTFFNLIAIIMLGKQAFRLLEDYRLQKKQGIKEPVFTKNRFKDLEQDLECW